MDEPPLSGRRILVLEDEMLVSLLIEDLLAGQQCVIVGTYSTVLKALGAAKTAEIDMALLDVNVAGERSYAVAKDGSKVRPSGLYLPVSDTTQFWRRCNDTNH